VSKRKGGGFGNRGGMPGGMGGMGGGGMLQQLQKMQQEMLKAQQELENETVEVTAGGGAITVVITGHQRVRSITVKPEVVNPEDVEMLQDLLVAAINQAIEKSQALAAERLEGVTGGMNLPPGLF
jgi:DNA-binding YbaB/EbfC family protein